MNSTLQQMVKLAKTDRQYLQAMIQLAKTAADGNSQTRFDESVPATDMPNPQDPSLQQGSGPMPQAGDPSQASNGQMQAPDDTSAFQQQDTPESAGARMAQAFLGPDVMQAALSGDANAMQLIATTAAALATSVGQQAQVQPQDQQQAPVDENGNPIDQQQIQVDENGNPIDPQQQGQDPNAQQQIPAAPQTPEEQVANLIVAPQQAPAAQPMQSPDQAGGGQGSQVQPGGSVQKKMPFKSDDRKAADQEKKQDAAQEKNASLNSITTNDLLSLIGIFSRL